MKFNIMVYRYKTNKLSQVILKTACFMVNNETFTQTYKTQNE